MLPYKSCQEESFANPVSEVTEFAGRDSFLQVKQQFERKKILDHMPRIEVDLDPVESQIFSFHYLYKDYLEDCNMIDVRLFEFEFNSQKER